MYRRPEDSSCLNRYHDNKLTFQKRYNKITDYYLKNIIFKSEITKCVCVKKLNQTILKPSRNRYQYRYWQVLKMKMTTN